MFKRFLVLTISVMMCFITALGTFGCSKTKEFTVTFDPDGGEHVGGGELVQVVSSASEIVEPELEKKGYNLIGWDEVLAEITTDTTVKAIWEKAKFVVTFVVSGGEKEENSGDDMQTVISAKDLKAPVYTRKGYDLVWDTDLKTITETCTVKGTWVAKKYALKFRDETDNFIDGVSDKEVTFDQSIGTLKTGIIIGEQKIVGWKVKNTETVLSSGQTWTFTADKTAVPIWDDVETFVINYDLDNGSHTGTPYYSYKEGHLGFTISDPSKTGYNFVGWQETDEDGLEIGTPVKGLTIEKGVLGDKYYKAIWSAKEFSVKLVTSYGTFEEGADVKEKTVKVEYDQEIDFPEIIWDTNEFLYWEYSTNKIENGDIWNIDDGNANFTFKAVFKKRYEFRLVMSCVVRDSEVESTLNDSNQHTTFQRNEGEELGKLPTYTPKDTEEYSSSYWKYKKGENDFAIVEAVTPARPSSFVGYEDDDLDGIIVVELYAWCRPNWTPAY
jgi:uncharacterized repeat protein (TIGR02543 family)